MPVITVLGASNLGESGCALLEIKIIEGTIVIPELNLTAADVSVYVLHDVTKRNGEPIIVKVEGLFKNPERTEEVQTRLARSIGEAVRKHFCDQLVEVFITAFDPVHQGFWSSGYEDKK